MPAIDGTTRGIEDGPRSSKCGFIRASIRRVRCGQPSSYSTHFGNSHGRQRWRAPRGQGRSVHWELFGHTGGGAGEVHTAIPSQFASTRRLSFSSYHKIHPRIHRRVSSVWDITRGPDRRGAPQRVEQRGPASFSTSLRGWHRQLVSGTATAQPQGRHLLMQIVLALSQSALRGHACGGLAFLRSSGTNSSKPSRRNGRICSPTPHFSRCLIRSQTSGQRLGVLRARRANRTGR